MKYLYPYECDKRGLSNPNELQAAIDSNRREGRRQSFGSSLFTYSPNGTPTMLSSPKLLTPSMSLPVSTNGASLTPIQKIKKGEISAWGKFTCIYPRPNKDLSSFLRVVSGQKRREASTCLGWGWRGCQQELWRVTLWLRCKRRQPRQQWQHRWRRWSSWGTNWRPASRRRRRWRCLLRIITDCCKERCNTTYWPWRVRYPWTSALITKVLKHSVHLWQTEEHVAKQPTPSPHYSATTPEVVPGYLNVELIFYLTSKTPALKAGDFTKDQ